MNGESWEKDTKSNKSIHLKKNNKKPNTSQRMSQSYFHETTTIYFPALKSDIFIKCPPLNCCGYRRRTFSWFIRPHVKITIRGEKKKKAIFLRLPRSRKSLTCGKTQKWHVSASHDSSFTRLWKKKKGRFSSTNAELFSWAYPKSILILESRSHANDKQWRPLRHMPFCDSSSPSGATTF